MRYTTSGKGYCKIQLSPHLPTADTCGGSGIDGMYGCRDEGIVLNSVSPRKLGLASTDRAIGWSNRRDVDFSSVLAANNIISSGLNSKGASSSVGPPGGPRGETPFVLRGMITLSGSSRTHRRTTVSKVPKCQQ